MNFAGSASRRGGAAVPLLLAVLFMAALLTMAWMLLLAPLSTSGLERRSGFPTRSDWLAANPFTGTVRGSGLAVDNPVARGGGAFLRTGDFEADIELTSLGETELVLAHARLDLRQLTLVIEADGSTNGGVWLEGLHAGAVGDSSAAPRFARAGWPWELGAAESVLIRRLDLTIGTLEVIDRTGSVPLSYREQLDFTTSLENVRDATDLLSPPLVQRLLAAPALWRALLRIGAGGGDSAYSAPRLWQQAGDLLNSVFRKLEESEKP